jgi:alpha-beta hydrolase superfamily lysophospholipase
LFTSNDYSREKTILQMTSNLYPDSEQLLQRWVSYAKENKVSATNALYQLIAASRYRSPRSIPDAPILLLSSENDRLVNSRSSVSLAQNWSLPIAIHPSAGHDIPLDDADWVCENIRQWLAGEQVQAGYTLISTK